MASHNHRTSRELTGRSRNEYMHKRYLVPMDPVGNPNRLRMGPVIDPGG